MRIWQNSMINWIFLTTERGLCRKSQVQDVISHRGKSQKRQELVIHPETGNKKQLIGKLFLDGPDSGVIVEVQGGERSGGRPKRTR
jgi:hypothetical protein